MLNSMKGSSKTLRKIMEKWKRKGHFVVYSKDNKRFVVPLCYLNHPILRVLLDMAEEEYGSTADGPLQVPCEKELVENILCLLRKHSDGDVDKAFLSVRGFRGAALPKQNQDLMVTSPVRSSCS